MRLVLLDLASNLQRFRRPAHHQHVAHVAESRAQARPKLTGHEAQGDHGGKDRPAEDRDQQPADFLILDDDGERHQDQRGHHVDLERIPEGRAPVVFADFTVDSGSEARHDPDQQRGRHQPEVKAPRVEGADVGEEMAAGVVGHKTARHDHQGVAQDVERGDHPVVARKHSKLPGQILAK